MNILIAVGKHTFHLIHKGTLSVVSVDLIIVKNNPVRDALMRCSCKAKSFKSHWAKGWIMDSCAPKVYRWYDLALNHHQ